MLEDQKYTQTLGDALASAPGEEQPKPTDDGLIHLSSGVVLSPKKVTPFVFQSVSSHFKDPEVPVVWNDNKQREEPNPMHPDYIKAVETADMERSMAMIDAVIALGTKLVNIPDGFPPPEDEDWLDDLETVGIIIDRSNKRMRYRTWVKFIAAPGVDDVQLIINRVLRMTGVTEEEVAKATASFQHQA